jgi:hypothetical protein
MKLKDLRRLITGFPADTEIMVAVDRDRFGHQRLTSANTAEVIYEGFQGDPDSEKTIICLYNDPDKAKQPQEIENISREYKISHLKRNGWKVTPLGTNIGAERKNERYRGSVGEVHRNVFGY